MKITILGCGSSGGVPLIGNDWGACDPANPLNRRMRVSALVEKGPTTILIDMAPDARTQLLACNAKIISAVIITHAHGDHCHGIDELRFMSRLTGKPIDVYADGPTMRELEARFDYVFHGNKPFYDPVGVPHVVDGPFEVGGIRITPFAQEHGSGQTLGVRLDDFAYSTDVKTLDEAAFAKLAGIKTWVVDCVREEPHPTHSHLAQTLEWIARVKPQRAYLTHMNETLDYTALSAKLPPGVWPAHDGLVFEC